MNLIEKVNKSFFDAYKSKNIELKNIIGTIKGEIERVSKNQKDISDSEVSNCLKSMLKKHSENKYLSNLEIDFINSILPQQMSEEEIDVKLKKIIDGGAINIGEIMSKFRGLNVDMKLVKQKVDVFLNEKKFAQ